MYKLMKTLSFILDFVKNADSMQKRIVFLRMTKFRTMHAPTECIVQVLGFADSLFNFYMYTSNYTCICAVL